MNAEIGHFALNLAFAVAIFQMVVPAIGAHKGWSGWIDSARPAPGNYLHYSRSNKL